MTIDTRRARPADVAARNAQDAERIAEEVAAFAEALADGTADASPEDDGLVPLSRKADRSTIRRIERFRDLREQIKDLTEKKDELRDELIAFIEDIGAQGLTLDGSVVARRTEVESTRTDGKRLKKAFPTIWARFSKTTKSVRLDVN